MLQTIRDRATGWIAYIIVGLLIIPFALWGVHQYVSDGGQLDAAKVGDTTISLQEFQRAYQQQRQRIQNLLGDQFDPARFDEAALRQEVLQQLINQNVLAQTARAQGFRVGDRQLHEAIRSIEAFQQNGAFDNDLYQRMLQTQGYTPAAFEQGLRDSLIINQLQQGIVESAMVTPAGLSHVIELLAEQRELSYVVLPIDTYLAQTEVDDAAVEAYFEENQRRFMKPEQVRVDYLELKLDQLAERISVSEDELRALYQEQAARYTQEEERSASHILVKVDDDAGETEIEQARSRARQIYESIVAGDRSFQQVLEEIQKENPENMEGGQLGVISKGMLDPEFENTLYALETAGDISEPVRTSFGFHIIRLDSVTPGQRQSFEEVRDEVAQDLRRRQAENRFYDMVETLSNLSYEHPQSLEPAAQALGLEIKESPWFGRNGDEGIADHPEVVSAAFSDEVLERGFNSEPIEVAPNHVVVIRVKDHQKVAPYALEEVRDEVVRELRLDQARKALQEDLEKLKERVEQGGDLQALAGEFGGEVKKPGLVRRDQESVDQPVLAEAFRLPRPGQGERSVGSVRLANGDQALIVVTRVVPGEMDDLPQAERQVLEARLSRQQGLAQFEGLVESLREQTDIVVYEDNI